MRTFKRLVTLAVICTVASFALGVLKFTIAPGLDWVIVLVPFLAPLAVFCVLAALVVLIVLIKKYED